MTGWQTFDVESRAADLRPIGDGRAAGLHLGEVIHLMKEAAGDPVGGIPGEPPWLRAQVGFLWEFALQHMEDGASLQEAMDVAFRRHMLASQNKVKQVTLEKDGIHMTPDGVDAERGRLESYKATWRSFRKAGPELTDFEDNFWAWHTQEKAYAYAAGLTSCRWVVLWVCGDYTKARGPRVEECTVTWTDQELRDNWAAVLAHAQEIKGRRG